MPHCSKCGTAAAFHELSNFAIPATPGETVERLCFKCTHGLRADNEELERMRAQMSREVNIVADIISEREIAKKQVAAFRNYLDARLKTVRALVGAERLAGNQHKLECELTALTELECAEAEFGSPTGARSYIHRDQVKPLVEALDAIARSNASYAVDYTAKEALEHAEKLGFGKEKE